MQHEVLTAWIKRTWVSGTVRWLVTLRTSVEVKAKCTRAGWDPCRSDEEAHWIRPPRTRREMLAWGL